MVLLHEGPISFFQIYLESKPNLAFQSPWMINMSSFINFVDIFLNLGVRMFNLSIIKVCCESIKFNYCKVKCRSFQPVDNKSAGD